MFKLIIFIVLLMPSYIIAEMNNSSVSDEEIKDILIKQSIAIYPRNCPCPYSIDRSGKSCGKRSAYSKAGGYSPVCYPDDVSTFQIQEYRNTFYKN